MAKATSIEARTSFNCLPNEIIFMIFDCLSSNDIIYTFFFLTQRLNHLLLQNQRYFNYLELPTKKLDTWEILLSIIGPQIKSLNITTIQLSFPLRYFPNLKSLIISSQYGLSEEKLKYIIENDIFQNLSSFKIKQEKIFLNPYLPDNVTYKDEIFKKVFNQNHSLKIFQYSLMTLSSQLNTHNLQMNFNLHSLTLTLCMFRHIFEVIKYTPNLKYLNVKTRLPLKDERSIIDQVNIKLEQLHLTLNRPYNGANFDLAIDGIKQFSSSLIYLSLDLVGFQIRFLNEFSFDSLRLPHLLESMKQLKQFHFYIKQESFRYNPNIDLSQFKKYSFNHNLSFGMQGHYIYTLPFHFDTLYVCSEDINEFKLINYGILRNNSRIWYNVKSIRLPERSSYDRDFVKELKTKMPKLTLIRFGGYNTNSRIHKQDSSENIDVTLDSVTTIEFMQEYIENQKDWIIYSLPNLRHLILSYTPLPSKDSELTPILNKKIQRLDIEGDCEIERLVEIDDGYFSNVENINIYFNYNEKAPEWYADIVIKILKTFKNLKIMMIRMASVSHAEGELSFGEKNVTKIIEYFDRNEMHKTYQVTYFGGYNLFSKKSFEI